MIENVYYMVYLANQIKDFINNTDLSYKLVRSLP